MSQIDTRFNGTYLILAYHACRSKSLWTLTLSLSLYLLPSPIAMRLANFFFLFSYWWSRRCRFCPDTWVCDYWDYILSDGIPIYTWSFLMSNDIWPCHHRRQSKQQSQQHHSHTPIRSRRKKTRDAFALLWAKAHNLNTKKVSERKKKKRSR